ncbi:Small ubiquitin-related modifier 3 [Acromyrmex echinatior]|uniref:Small ubiquitin-related modifier 3 n=1 Tax=Acromyrmex echinatior TaxID=103372 RepID=F4WPV4_ACREC|nr:Small ubiquitin-related modifier 3 [Acromyrmex echinatior]
MQIRLRTIRCMGYQGAITWNAETKTESEHINLKVLGQDNAVVQFKIKKHTPLRKLMNAYCDRVGLAIAAVRFRFDGQPINELDTPTSLEMEEGDTIEVYQQQTGGFSGSHWSGARLTTRLTTATYSARKAAEKLQASAAVSVCGQSQCVKQDHASAHCAVG